MPGSPDDTLLAMMTPMAPALWALNTLNEKSHVPRSMSAILPLTAVAFVSAVQPFVGTDATTSPVTPVVVRGVPNSADCASLEPAIVGGELTTKRPTGGDDVEQLAAVRSVP
jgi:hypothetical protein